jgi:hypothetical protein
MRKELKFENADDGVFWIAFDDFVKHFNRLHVCRLYEDDVGEKWQHTEIKGEWKVQSVAHSERV